MKHLYIALLIGPLTVICLVAGAHAWMDHTMFALNRLSFMGHFAHQAFTKADTNGDGKITKQEFETARAKRFSEMDSNGDGFLTVSEMEEHVPPMARRHVKMRFEQMDTNKDGKINRSEFDAAGEKLFQKLDVNGDGVLTEDELPKFKGRAMQTT